MAKNDSCCQSKRYTTDARNEPAIPTPIMSPTHKPFTPSSPTKVIKAPEVKPHNHREARLLFAMNACFPHARRMPLQHPSEASNIWKAAA